MKYVFDIEPEDNQFRVVIIRKTESGTRLIGVPFRGTYSEIVRVMNYLRYAFDYGYDAAKVDIGQQLVHLPTRAEDIVPDEDTLELKFGT